MNKKQITNTNNLQILYEDNHIIIINKRPGDIVQGDKTGDKPLSDIVKQYLKEQYNKIGNAYLGVVHRLDRPSSGIVIFAKTSKALSRLNSMFSEKEVKKTYWAVVRQKPIVQKAELIHWLKKNPKNNKSSVYKSEIVGSKKAILSYHILKPLDRYTLLEVNLKTGRHHQIRAQLSYIGSPIRGDIKYGYNRTNANGSIHLHARAIYFKHPIRQVNISILAKPPQGPIWDACIKNNL